MTRAMRVLCAYDGSATAAGAIRAAATLLGPCEATVVTVREGPPLADATALSRVPLPEHDLAATLAQIDAELLGRARATADRGAALARDLGLRADTVVLQAPRPWRAIERVAAGHDLIVCGTRGRGLASRVALGSTASSLLAHAGRPILVVPSGAEPGSGPFVAGYDGTAAADVAVRFAARILRSRPYVVACAWRSPVRHSLDAHLLRMLPFGETGGFLDDYEALVAGAAQAHADEGAEVIAATGLQSRARTVESDATPWRPLLALAEDEHASLLVCGAGHAGRSVSGLVGSVAAGLVHHSPLPVLVVPGAAATAASSSKSGDETAALT